MLTTALVERILESLPGLTIGLVGDLFLDRYFDIDPALDEPSVETGLTAYQVTGVRSYPGALGTVLNNLVALGVGRIVPVSFVGDDGEGYELKQALGRMPAVDSSFLVTTAERRTPTYCKPMRGGVELNRLDIKNRTPTSRELLDRILERAKQAWEGANAWIVLDQVSEVDCGVVTHRVRSWISEQPQTGFILADSRERIHEFANVCIKPNEREAKTLDPVRVKAIFATRGENGIQLVEKGKTQHIPAYPVSGPVDICGAGDSCSAGITCAVAAGASFAQAAAFGNLVASITIQQIGITGTASPEQVRRRWADVGGS
jgi:bifunctional ADP-heptose synthase (sugar kinase/adenylyltransferase)